MAKTQKMGFFERMKAGRANKGSMKGYIFMFALCSVAILSTYLIGFIDITDGVHSLGISGENIIFGNTGPSCILEYQETCVAPLPMTITLVANQLFIIVYGLALITLVLSFFVKKNRAYTYFNAIAYIIIAIMFIISPSIIQITDGVNSIKDIVQPSLNNAATTVVVLSGLAAVGNLIVYRASGNL